MAGNQAAWLDGTNKELRVAAAEFPKARSGEVVIRNFAVAINPADCTSEALRYDTYKVLGSHCVDPRP